MTEVAFAFKRKLEGGRMGGFSLSQCLQNWREGSCHRQPSSYPLQGAVEILKEIRDMAVKGTGKTRVLREY